MIRQTVNRFPCPVAFGDERSERRHQRRVEAAWKAQSTRWAVAPGCTVRCADGRVLKEGDAIKPGDLVVVRQVGVDRRRTGPDVPIIRATDGRAKIRELVGAGRVLERGDIAETEEPEPAGPEAA